MKKPYAILRLEKRKSKGDITRSNNHNHRIGPQRPNINVDGPRPRLLAGVADAPAELGRRTPDKHRKDAVLAIEFVVTASPEWFVSASPDEYDRWVEKNTTWLQQELGANFVQAVLHEDELTPHIHCYASCLVDEKLCFAKMYGTPSSLVKLQDRYALAMKSFGLKRGERGSTATHEDIKGMAKRMDRLENALGEVAEALKTLSKHITGLEGMKGLQRAAKAVASGLGASGEVAGEASAKRRGPATVCPEVSQKAAPRAHGPSQLTQARRPGL